MQVSFLAPLAAVGGGPFCPRRDLLLLLFIRYVGSSFSLAYLSVDVTGALVSHPPKCIVFGHLSVLVCLSVDVTVHLCFSFACFRCFHSCFVHAPFPCFLFALRSALPWSCAPCPALTLFVLLSVSLVGLLSLACVALRSACDCVVCVLFLLLLAVLLVVFALLAVLGWALLLLLLSALLWFGFFPRPLCLPSPAGCLVWCSGPACTLACWYLPLGIRLQL